MSKYRSQSDIRKERRETDVFRADKPTGNAINKVTDYKGTAKIGLGFRRQSRIESTKKVLLR